MTLDITTLPKVNELILTSGADYTLTCIGDAPVTWVRDKVENIEIKVSIANPNVIKDNSIDQTQVPSYCF